MTTFFIPVDFAWAAFKFFSHLFFSKDDLDYIRTHTKLNRREMCGVLFGLKCSRITSQNLNWSVSIPRRPNSVERRSMNARESLSASASVYSVTNFNTSTNPLQVSPSHGVNLNQSPSASAPVAASAGSLSNSGPSEDPTAIPANQLLQIVQITDIHVDPYYVPGSNADCGEPLCCRHTSGIPKHPSKAAGVWGDYVSFTLKVVHNSNNDIRRADVYTFSFIFQRNCDTPVNTLRNTLKQISESHPNVSF